MDTSHPQQMPKANTAVATHFNQGLMFRCAVFTVSLQFAMKKVVEDEDEV